MSRFDWCRFDLQESPCDISSESAMNSTTTFVEVIVGEVRAVRRGRVLALASAELVVDGVAFVVHGLQVVHGRDAMTGREATGVELPRFRDPRGVWCPALDLPEELRKPLGDAVLERCCALGITKRLTVDA